MYGRKAFWEPFWAFRDTAVHVVFKFNLQDTLKTRYFSVYLACMRVERFFRGCFGRSGTPPKRSSTDAYPPPIRSRSAANRVPRRHHHVRRAEACDFPGQAMPGRRFFSGFFVEKTAFFLEKMEKNGILFQFGFLKQASTQTTEISLWRSGKTSRKS